MTASPLVSSTCRQVCYQFLVRAANCHQEIFTVLHLSLYQHVRNTLKFLTSIVALLPLETTWSFIFLTISAGSSRTVSSAVHSWSPSAQVYSPSSERVASLITSLRTLPSVTRVKRLCCSVISSPSWERKFRHVRFLWIHTGSTQGKKCILQLHSISRKIFKICE